MLTSLSPRLNVLSLVAPMPEPTVDLTKSQLRDLLLLAHLGAHTLKSLPLPPTTLINEFTSHLTHPQLQRIADDGLMMVARYLPEVRG